MTEKQNKAQATGQKVGSEENEELVIMKLEGHDPKGGWY